MSQLQLSTQDDERITNDIFRIISSEQRFRILNALWNTTKRHLELMPFIKPKDNAKTLLCWHLRCLKAHYLINHKDGLYSLTHRGKIVTKALREIKASELFIGDT